MFTGIIAHIGKLRERKNMIFTFEAKPSLTAKLHSGMSIAVNGACLTVQDKIGKNLFSVEAMPETVKKTTLNSLKINELVNLELPMTIDSFFSGHIVQGHVDGTGFIKKITREKNSRILNIAVPKKLSKYIVEKGSVCVNGISLTVINADSSQFSVGIIPYTWKQTMLSQIKLGDSVNIEADIIAKYIGKLLKKGKKVNEKNK